MNNYFMVKPTMAKLEMAKTSLLQNVDAVH
jgi:hypothetical protein